MIHGCLVPSLFDIVLKVLATAIKQEKQKECVRMEKKITLPSVTDDMKVYGKELIDKLFKLISDFSC